MESSGALKCLDIVGAHIVASYVTESAYLQWHTILARDERRQKHPERGRVLAGHAGVAQTLAGHLECEWACAYAFRKVEISSVW
jgi:hypothetical protein